MKPQTVEEFTYPLNEREVEIILRAIKIDRAFQSYLNSKICAVCDVELFQGNWLEPKADHFNRVCKDHAEHVNTLIIDMIREELGIEPRPIS